jgi:PAS domain S-box-containing protein
MIRLKSLSKNKFNSESILMGKIEKKIADIFYQKLCNSKNWNDLKQSLLADEDEDNILTTLEKNLGFSENLFEKSLESLHYFKNQLNGFFEINDDLFVISKIGGTFVKINHAWEKILGYSREELLSMPFLSFIHPDDVESTAKEFEEIIKGKITASFTNRYISSSGEYRWLNWTSKYNTKEKLIYAVARDITEKREMDILMEESEEKYRLLIEYSPIGIGVHRNGKILYTNPKATEMLGAKSQEEMIGLPVMQFIHPDYRPLVLGRLKELAQGIDQLQATDEKFVRLGGEVIDVEVIAKTINFNGEKAFQIIFTDITEKKIISKEKERLNSEILIQNQELAFQEEELRSANEELLANKEELEKILNELSNRNFELDQLVYKISHDLRAPLSTILGLVSIYKIEEKPEKQAEYIDLVENRVHKLDGFIKSMLNYAKANRTEIILQDIDFKELIHSCISDLEYLSYFDEINIELSINDDIEGYQGDLLRLKILFSNIISNAYKYRNPYSKESFIKINIQKKEEQFFIEFIDNGMGIEEIHIDKIFNMFYRATTHSEGSGLGLYIVKQTIDKLNGFIQIESEYGEGTVLKIFLPF